MQTPQPISYPADGNAACLEVEDRSFWFRHRNECISALVAAWPCEGRLVDVGGGNGFVARMFYSTVPVHAWLWSGADDAAGHFRRYSLDSYRALLAERFELVYASYFFGALVVPAALMRALPYRLGRRAPPSAHEAAREHGTSGGMLTRILAGALRHEVERIVAREPMAWGSRLIVAARKRA